MGEGRGQGHWGQGDPKGEAERKACVYLDSGWPALPLHPATPAVTPCHSPPLVCSVRPIHSPTQPRRSPPDRSYTPGLHPAGHGGQGASRQHPPPPTFFRMPEIAVRRSGRGLSPWTTSPPECSFLAQRLTEAGAGMGWGGTHKHPELWLCALTPLKTSPTTSSGLTPGPFTPLVKPRLFGTNDTYKVHPRRLRLPCSLKTPTVWDQSHRMRVDNAHAVLPSASVQVHTSTPANLNTAFKIQLKRPMFQQPSQTAPHPNHRDTPHLSFHPLGNEY